MSKKKVVLDTLSGLSNNGLEDVHRDVLIQELMATKKFNNIMEVETTLKDYDNEGILMRGREKNTYSFKSAIWNN